MVIEAVLCFCVLVYDRRCGHGAHWTLLRRALLLLTPRPKQHQGGRPAVGAARLLNEVPPLRRTQHHSLHYICPHRNLAKQGQMHRQAKAKMRTQLHFTLCGAVSVGADAAQRHGMEQEPRVPHVEEWLRLHVEVGVAGH